MMKRLFFYISLMVIASTFMACSHSVTGDRVFNIESYGAVGDGVTDNAEAIQSAIDDCNKSGGGRVYVPKGLFMSSPLELKSNIDLHLGVGSKIIANPDESVYHESAFKENRGEGMMWLYGYNVENLTISGKGSLDGNSRFFMGDELVDSYVLKPVHEFDPRPHLLTIIGGKRIKIEDLHIGNSAYWAVHLVGCDDVVVKDITLLNDLKVRNGDGIDLDHSKNVRISGCYIVSGDDCICLKNRREYEEFGPCENIVVTSCNMVSRSCAIKIGSENVDRIGDVLFTNCVIKDSNRGIGIQNRDEGVVEDVVFSNMIVDCKFYSDVWWGKSEPIYITAYPRRMGDHKDAGWRFPKGANQGVVGSVNNITFSNIKCNSENGIFIGGDTPDKVYNIMLDGIDLNIFKRTDYPGGIYDKRPCEGEEFIQGFTAGFYIKEATGVTVMNSLVKWGKVGSPFYTKKIVMEGAVDCHVVNLFGKDVK